MGREAYLKDGRGMGDKICKSPPRSTKADAFTLSQPKPAHMRAVTEWNVLLRVLEKVAVN